MKHLRINFNSFENQEAWCSYSDYLKVQEEINCEKKNAN